MAVGPRRRRTTAPLPALFASQALFNLGFFAVVPFLAITMRDDHGLGGAAVGLVLGVRAFSQQGLFLLGGLLHDRYGARTLIALGCAVRVLGYLALAYASDLTGFVIGAVLTGLGGALFSPALDALVGAADARASPTRPEGRPSLFVGLLLVGEVGAALGPLVGAMLLGVGFSATAGVAAALFAVVGTALWLLVPSGAPPAPARTTAGRPSFDRRFVVFAALFGVNLLAYNQLYLGLGFEVARVGGDAASIGLVFLLLSLLTLAGQWPLGVWAWRLGAGRALTLGFGAIAVGFASLAVASAHPPQPGRELLPAIAMTALLALGHMLVGPVALGLVPRFAGSRPLGAHYGLLATCGGLAVLGGSVALGPLFDSDAFPLAWSLLAAAALVSALALPRLLPRSDSRTIPSLPPVTERHHAP
ncbi:MFS transporter [Rathayibacter sp. VKM Ac-2754]|uniref:MFS transporter n=1 Tax=Rathayibacter sp. VKM Ac-2754 TaxID=2609251 RepID=UPI00135BE0C6|nr:MFS transporter [Rathayibacter sp. VKM Ac-2754]MWV58699.1 MFS transporter [Rathayibacter sp. VKM Ac-2754]